jgi:DNA-binding Lrp family transcriptional regulator
VAVPDAVDARLLALVAEVGRVAVHDLAKRAGMDVREVAARLAALAAGGLPLVVGVECDPAALRHALGHGPAPAPGHPVGYPPVARGAQGMPSGPHQVGQPYPPAQSGPVPMPGHPSQPGQPQPTGTWGPPGSAAWARGDGDDELVTATVRTTPARRASRTGTVGDTLHVEGPDGERLAMQLVEVVDPADFLFTAAGYRLQPGERSVVVHTELTNRGRVPFAALPDLHLVLLDGEGNAVRKAPVALSSRPPHRIGVKPGETAGGHTVYVLPEATELAAVRWNPGPDRDDEQSALTWTVRE